MDKVSRPDALNLQQGHILQLNLKQSKQTLNKLGFP